MSMSIQYIELRSQLHQTCANRLLECVSKPPISPKLRKAESDRLRTCCASETKEPELENLLFWSMGGQNLPAGQRGSTVEPDESLWTFNERSKLLKSVYIPNRLWHFGHDSPLE